jgi:hypothetical protein
MSSSCGRRSIFESGGNPGEFDPRIPSPQVPLSFLQTVALRKYTAQFNAAIQKLVGQSVWYRKREHEKYAYYLGRLGNRHCNDNEEEHGYEPKRPPLGFGEFRRECRELNEPGATAVNFLDSALRGESTSLADGDTVADIAYRSRFS